MTPIDIEVYTLKAVINWLNLHNYIILYKWNQNPRTSSLRYRRRRKRRRCSLHREETNIAADQLGKQTPANAIGAQQHTSVTIK